MSVFLKRKATAPISESDVIQYVEGMPFTPRMLKAFDDYKKAPKPQREWSSQDILDLID